MPTAPLPVLLKASHLPPMMRRLASAGWAWAAVVAIGLLSLPTQAWLRSLCLAPLVEEAVLRWGVQDPLQRRLHAAHPAWPVLLAAVAFAAAHMAFSHGSQDLLRAAATALPAAWIGEIYRRSPRLLPCVAWHAGFNLLWLLLLSKWLID